MLAVKGVYKDGQVILRNDIGIRGTVGVIVTFLDGEETTPVAPEKAGFSFRKAREVLKDLKGSLGDEVIAERRSEL